MFGLKILRASGLCGFDSRPRHQTFRIVTIPTRIIPQDRFLLGASSGDQDPRLRCGRFGEPFRSPASNAPGVDDGPEPDEEQRAERHEELSLRLD
jgi:hypothetical protein